MESSGFRNFLSFVKFAFGSERVKSSCVKPVPIVSLFNVLALFLLFAAVQQNPRVVQLMSHPYNGNIILSAGPAQFGLDLTRGDVGVCRR